MKVPGEPRQTVPFQYCAVEGCRDDPARNEQGFFFFFFLDCCSKKKKKYVCNKFPRMSVNIHTGIYTFLNIELFSRADSLADASGRAHKHAAAATE